MDYIYTRKINYYETDKMGVVHHSNYIRFLEEARCHFLKDIGLPYDELENIHIMIPVISIVCNYKNAVTYGDTISIKISIKEFTGTKLIISYTAINSINDKIIVTAETTHCFTNSDLKPVNLKKYNKDIYNNFSLQLNNYIV